MALEGYTEQYVDQQGDVITIQRHDPLTHRQVCATCHTAYQKDKPDTPLTLTIKLPGIDPNYDSSCLILDKGKLQE